MPRRPHLDTTLSAVIFLLFAGISAYAYASIIKTEAPSYVFMRSIELGSKEFHLMHSTECIGVISTKLAKGDNTFVHSVGEASGGYGDNFTTAKIDTLLQFNPLGQLVQSSTSITARDTKIVITSKDINPIRFNIQAAIAKKQYQFNLSAPGPVLLKQVDAETYQIEYSQVRAGSGSLLQGLGTGFLSNAELNLVEAKKSKIKCSPQERSSLDLTAILNKAHEAEDTIRSFFPDPRK